MEETIVSKDGEWSRRIKSAQSALALANRIQVTPGVAGRGGDSIDRDAHLRMELLNK